MTESIYESGEYLAKVPDWHRGHSAWKADHILRVLARNKLNPSTICDIGCGAGGVLEVLADRLPKATLTGYETARMALALRDTKERKNLSFRAVDAFTVPDTYDLAMALDVFEHVEDYIGFLRKMKPKGRHKLYHIPLDMSVQMVARQTPLAKVRAIGHLHYFSKDTALATLAHTGHEIVDWCYTAGMVEVGASSLKSRLLAFPRRAVASISPDLAAHWLGGYSLLVLCT
jgi:2-polyprenyl-3-methyl-5-hydroxy-6-metoxy-1,4-benzoquinol methylase